MSKAPLRHRHTRSPIYNCLVQQWHTTLVHPSPSIHHTISARGIEVHMKCIGLDPGSLSIIMSSLWMRMSIKMKCCWYPVQCAQNAGLLHSLWLQWEKAKEEICWSYKPMCGPSWNSTMMRMMTTKTTMMMTPTTINDDWRMTKWVIVGLMNFN